MSATVDRSSPETGASTASHRRGAALGREYFSCPGGQRLVFASVSYTNIVLTDTTNGMSTTAPDTSRTFFDV